MNCSATASKHNNLVASRGFTLVELMVTIAVMAVIVSIAAPSFANQIASKRINATANTFVTAFQTAKSEALIRQKSIDIVVNNSGSAKQIKVQTVASTPVIIKKYQINKSSLMIAKNSAPTTYRISSVGTVSKTDNNAISANSYYEICDNQVSGEKGKKIIISAVGQVKVISSGVVCS